jgi:FkbM family methyltransferase
MPRRRPLADVRCAVAGSPALAASLDAARIFGVGDFRTIDMLANSGAGMAGMRQAAASAADRDYDWLLVVGGGETLSPDVFVKTAPALRVHEAVWGGAALGSPDRLPPKVERITRLAAQDLPTFFHAALRWWIGPTHFVRPKLAADAVHAADSAGCYADYMYHLWKHRSAYKTAQALTFFEAEIPPVAEAVRARLVEILEKEPVFAPVTFGASTFHLPYTGLNPVIEREQMRGLFFEQEELEFLAARLPRGLRIVDAGANTGNHTVFFAGVLEAEIVIPIEPLPRAAEAIRSAVAKNRLANVDPTCLGKAIGATEALLRPVPSLTAGLGATHFVPDPGGIVPMVPLDRLIRGRVDFLKIDVEGMEMEALAGAAGLIAANRPMLYVEVLDSAIAEFITWVDKNRYRVERLFPDKAHCNYLLIPRG